MTNYHQKLTLIFFFICSVTVRELTVNSLLREDDSDKVVGVSAQSKTNEYFRVSFIRIHNEKGD